MQLYGGGAYNLGGPEKPCKQGNLCNKIPCNKTILTAPPSSAKPRLCCKFGERFLDYWMRTQKFALACPLDGFQGCNIQIHAGAKLRIYGLTNDSINLTSATSCSSVIKVSPPFRFFSSTGTFRTVFCITSACRSMATMISPPNPSSNL